MALVSVIITTRNEEKNIGNCLESLSSQLFRDFDTIVVDNNSTDRTVEIARQYTTQVYNLGPERSAQRNFGVKKSQARYVLYLDADMILEPDVIQVCVQQLESIPNLVALYIPEKIVGNGFWIRVRNFERSFYDGTVIDAVRFIRRESFLLSGGFDSTLCGPEDWDFDRRIRKLGRVGICRSHLNHNEGNFNLKTYIKKKGYYSQSFGAYIAKWGADDPEIKKQLGMVYRLLFVYLEDGKFWKILRHPLLTLGMYYLRFWVGLTYLRSRNTAMHSKGSD